MNSFFKFSYTLSTLYSNYRVGLVLLTTLMCFTVGLAPIDAIAKKNRKPQKIFEGYYKILSGNKHIGYVIHRYQYNEYTLQFQSTYYMKTNKIGGDLTESLNAFADNKFRPISYQLTSTAGKSISIIDANFKGRKMTGTISNGKVSQPINTNLKEGVFLSTFLVYMMKSRQMSLDKRFSYNAIAEEDGKTHVGEALVTKNFVNFKGENVYRILNEFKGAKFISYVNKRGEVYGTRSPAQRISTELVNSAAEATAGIEVNINHLKKLFGYIPTGRTHALKMTDNLNKQKLKTLAPSTQNDGKNSFPAGQGVMIKNTTGLKSSKDFGVQPKIKINPPSSDKKLDRNLPAKEK